MSKRSVTAPTRSSASNPASSCAASRAQAAAIAQRRHRGTPRWPASSGPWTRAVAVSLLLLSSPLGWAQTGAPPPSDLPLRRAERPRLPPPTPPASSPSPRPPTVDDGRMNSAPAGDLQQERAVVVPQLSLPLGRTPPPPTTAEARRLDTRRPALRGGIDDAAARCGAQSDPQARARCRTQVPVGTTSASAPR